MDNTITITNYKVYIIRNFLLDELAKKSGIGSVIWCVLLIACSMADFQHKIFT